MLKIQDLHWNYGGSFSMDSLNLTLESGSLTGIIGPNGSGKSTLIRLILNILTPPEHTIFLKGRDLRQLTPRDRARLASYVPQLSERADNFTVDQLLRMGRYHLSGGYTPSDDSIIDEVLQRLSLVDFRFRPADQLSGGEFQRVLLARALVQQTELVILDEPTNHLDLTYQWDILQLLKEEQQSSGITLLAVFHDINLAMEFCDNILLMDQGQCKFFGTPHALLDENLLEQTFSMAFTRSSNELTGKPHLIPAPLREGITK